MLEVRADSTKYIARAGRAAGCKQDTCADIQIRYGRVSIVSLEATQVCRDGLRTLSYSCYWMLIDEMRGRLTVNAQAHENQSNKRTAVPGPRVELDPARARSCQIDVMKVEETVSYLHSLLIRFHPLKGAPGLPHASTCSSLRPQTHATPRRNQQPLRRQKPARRP